MKITGCYRSVIFVHYSCVQNIFFCQDQEEKIIEISWEIYFRGRPYKRQPLFLRPSATGYGLWKLYETGHVQ